MKKQKSGKALPILTIIFSAVSILLFASKLGVSVVQVLVTGISTPMNGFASTCIKVGLMAFPTLLMIIFAAQTLKKKQPAKGIFIALLIAQVLSCGFIIARAVWLNAPLQFNRSYLVLFIYIAMYLLILVLCTVSAFLVIKDKHVKVLVIIASAVGLLVAVLVFGYYLINVLTNFNFYLDHLFLFACRLSRMILYAAALVFYYVAFLFTPLFKGIKSAQENKVKVTIKS